MDERVEAFLADVLALEGEGANAIRQVVRGALADCEQIFRAQEVNKRMREKAAHACHALCRARVAEEMRLRKGTPTAEHLKLVLGVIDGPRSHERTKDRREIFDSPSGRTSHRSRLCYALPNKSPIISTQFDSEAASLEHGVRNVQSSLPRHVECKQWHS
jgi:hypothetical protein